SEKGQEGEEVQGQEEEVVLLQARVEPRSARAPGGAVFENGGHWPAFLIPAITASAPRTPASRRARQIRRRSRGAASSSPSASKSRGRGRRLRTGRTARTPQASSP